MNKSNKSYEDSARACFWSYIGIFVLLIWMMLFSGCYGTYYITDAEYDDAREEHLAVTYYNNSIYWGWNSGYYYYYGKPHYYPWHYYYNTCPPSHYNLFTHFIVQRPVTKPTYRPKRNTVKPNVVRNIHQHNNSTIYVKPNRNINVKTNKSNVKVNTSKPVNRRKPK